MSWQGYRGEGSNVAAIVSGKKPDSPSALCVNVPQSPGSPVFTLHSYCQPDHMY